MHPPLWAPHLSPHPLPCTARRANEMSHNTTDSLLRPQRLYSRAEFFTNPCPVPAKRGVYAWYFSEIPPGVPTSGCVTFDGHTLLYIGISPKNDSSSQNLRKRIRHHYGGNAEGSTLRLTLGVLLAERSEFPLRRVGSGSRMTLTHLANSASISGLTITLGSVGLSMISHGCLKRSYSRAYPCR